MPALLRAALVCLAGTMATGASATDDGFEFWLNPSASIDLDGDTALEIETAQRFRDAGDGRVDTYYARLWLNQDVSDSVTLSGAFERRINDGGPDEIRVIQQMSTSRGVLRTRVRFEQRFVDDADRMGLRLRPRLGVTLPLGSDERWSVGANAELFLTLRSNSRGGDDGLTGIRTQIEVDYKVSDQLSLGLAYLRNQDIAPDGPDRVGHAPLLGVEYSF